MNERKYLPTFGELCDRLSIVLLKQIFIPKNRVAYVAERDLIEHDIDLLLNDAGKAIRAFHIRTLMILMLTNRYIWTNEAATRSGHADQVNDKLRQTHAINGVRNTAKNILSERMGDRLDLKIDCLAADLPKIFGEDWNVFEGVK